MQRIQLRKTIICFRTPFVVPQVKSFADVVCGGPYILWNSVSLSDENQAHKHTHEKRRDTHPSFVCTIHYILVGFIRTPPII